MSRQSRRGLTRVEVIVIAVAIFLLLGLLIPLTNSARDGGGRRGQCMNNQKQFGLAASQYAATTNEMPPVITTFTPTKFVYPPDAVKKQPAGPYYAGWFQYLSPQLEHFFIYGVYYVPDAKTALAGSEVPHVYDAVCPDAPDRIDVAGALSYAVNAGRFSDSPIPEGFPVGKLLDGVWDDRSLAGTGKPVPHTTLDYIAKNGGLSHTILLSENLDTVSWVLSPKDEKFEQTLLWDPVVQTRINEKVGTGLSNATARPSSNHPGGAVFCYCDGHVNFISDAIDYKVYVALMTGDGDYADAELSRSNASSK